MGSPPPFVSISTGPEIGFSRMPDQRRLIFPFPVYYPNSFPTNGVGWLAPQSFLHCRFDSGFTSHSYRVSSHLHLPWIFTKSLTTPSLVVHTFRTSVPSHKHHESPFLSVPYHLPCIICGKGTVVRECLRSTFLLVNIDGRKSRRSFSFCVFPVTLILYGVFHEKPLNWKESRFWNKKFLKWSLVLQSFWLTMVTTIQLCTDLTSCPNISILEFWQV